MPVTPTYNFRLTQETLAQLTATAKREGLGSLTAAIRWLATRDARTTATAATTRSARTRTMKET